MFFSTDLLGKKSPMGVIWLISHGKQVSRRKIMQVKVDELCSELLEPAVPHALRLQGILCAGVTRVFSKQQTYLLHDCQDMVKRVSQSMMPNQDEQTMLPKKKQTANRDAITLDLNFVPFEEDLEFKAYAVDTTLGRQSDDDELFYLEIDPADYPGANGMPAGNAAGLLRMPAASPLFQLPHKASRNGSTDWGNLATPGRQPQLTHQLPNGNGEPSMLLCGVTSSVFVEPEVFQGVQLEDELEDSSEDEEFNEAMRPEELTQTLVEDSALKSPAQEDQLIQGDTGRQAQGDGTNDDTVRGDSAVVPEEVAAVCGKHGVARSGRRHAKRLKPCTDSLLDVVIDTHRYRSWQLDSSDIVHFRSRAQQRADAIKLAENKKALGSFSASVLSAGPSLPELKNNPTLLWGLFDREALLRGAPSSNVASEKQRETKVEDRRVSGADLLLSALEQVKENGDCNVDRSKSEQKNLSEDDEHMDKLTHLPPGRQNALLNSLALERGSGGAIATPTVSSDLEIEALREKGGSMTPGTGSRDGSHHLGLTPGFPAGDRIARQSFPQSNSENVSEKDVPQQLAIASPAPHLTRLLRRRGSGTSEGDNATSNELGTGLNGGLTSDVSAIQLGISTPEAQPSLLALGTQATTTSAKGFSDITQDTRNCVQDFKDEFSKTGEEQELSFFKITGGLSKRDAAMVFFQLQVMISHDFINVQQNTAYGDMIISKGANI